MSPNPSANESGAAFESLEPRLLLAVSAEEQMFVYLLNRARHDPAAYQTEAGLVVDLTGIPAAPPLAINDIPIIAGNPNSDLCQAAENFAQDMAANNYIGYYSATYGGYPNKMVRQWGYPLPASYPDNGYAVESIAAGYSQPQDVLRALIEDGGAPLPENRWRMLGMETYAADREIGVGHAYNAASDYKDYWAVDTAYRTSPNPNLFLTGVVFDDVNGNGRYDFNEGISNVTINTATAVTFTNVYGGYSLPVTSGQQVMMVQGGGFSGQATAAVNVGSQNVEVDFISGQWTGIINFGSGVAPPVTPPASVSASDGTYTDKVQVTWSASANATSYGVWRNITNSSATAELLDTVAATSYNDTGAQAGTKYYYWVQAKNASDTSGFSVSDAGRRNAVPTAGTLTAAPGTLTCGDKVKLTLAGAADADGTISKVQFYADVNGNGTFDPAADTPLGYGTAAAGAWSWTGPTTRKFGYGTVHVFARAMDNNSAWSNAADATLTVINPDPFPPTAQLTIDPMVASPGASYAFRVAYEDNVAVDASTIGAGDILVTGPNGFKKAATLVRTSTKVDGPSVEAYYTVAAPGGTWDYADNGTYTVAMVANQVFDTNFNPVDAGPLGTFDVTLPDSPDLVVGIGKSTLPTPLVPGDKGAVSVLVTNIGGQPIKGSVVTNLVLASDPQDPQTFIPLGSQTKTVALKPGQTCTLTFNVIIQASEGSYYLLAQTNAGAAPLPELRTDNNTGQTAGAVPLVWQFGTIAARKKVALTVYDADDSLVTFALTGPGTGQVADTGLGLGVALTGTTTASSAAVTAKKSAFPGSDAEASLGDITVGDTASPADTTSLGSFTARSGNLHGDLTVMGTLKSLTLNSADGAKTIAIRCQMAATDAVALAFGRVAGVSVVSAVPIKSLTATEWLDPVQTSLIEAPSIGTVTIKGDTKSGLLGNFQAVVNLKDAAAKQSLGTMTVAGWLDGAQIHAPSAVGSVTVGGLRNCLIYAGVNDGVTGLPDPTTAFAAMAAIKRLTVKGIKSEPFSTINSDIAAYSLGTITLAGIQFSNKLPDDTPVPFGLAGHTLTKLNYRDGKAVYSWPNKIPEEQLHPLPREQFEVNLA